MAHDHPDDHGHGPDDPGSDDHGPADDGRNLGPAEPAPSALTHDHLFLGAHHDRNARKTWIVVGFCTAMMGLEIGAGMAFNSLALLADGAHMATHAGALLIAALAYRLARRRAHDRRFSFGTGKVGDLSAFGSAIVLGCVSLFIAAESLQRLAHPLPIGFNQAIPIAVLGLAVNVVSAWLLHEGDAHAHPGAEGHGHGHTHDHSHDHGGGGHSHDFNLRAAYAHVAADAMVSVLAIVGLLIVRQFGWLWVDPLMGIVGAVVIAQWSVTLMRATGGVLLDMEAAGPLAGEIRRRLAADGATVTDLHIWRLGPGHNAAIVALAGRSPAPVQHYRDLLRGLPGLSHLTVEVAPSPGPEQASPVDKPRQSRQTKRRQS